MEKIKFKKVSGFPNYSLVLLEDTAIKVTGVDFGHWYAYGVGKNSNKKFITANGNKFTIHADYAWDGCTGAPDASWNYRASLFHDAMYQAKKCGAKTTSWCNIDKIFLLNMKNDGANFIERNTYYSAVITIGALWKFQKLDSLRIKYYENK